MSTKKWEQLIDHMLNEDQERAEQLFHEIVVEQSRAIYESLMDEDGDAVSNMMAEIEHEDEGGDGMMEADDEMDMDDADMDMDDAEADMNDADMDMDDAEADMGDADMDMDDAEADMDDADMDMGDDGEPATKDDIMNLEDKLDELMAEFESMMHSRDEGGEEEAEEEEEEVMESVQLKKVGGETYNKFGKMGDDGAQTKSPVAANAGAKGPVGSVVKPVKFSGDSESVPTSPKQPSSAAYHTKSEQHLPGAGKFKNAPNGAGKVARGQGEPTPKPKHEDHKSKSPVAESKKTTKRVVK